MIKKLKNNVHGLNYNRLSNNKTTIDIINEGKKWYNTNKQQITTTMAKLQQAEAKEVSIQHENATKIH